MKVLIADDSALMRERLETMLSEIEGVSIIGKSMNVIDTLSRVELDHPDVVILDIKMIGGNGIDVLKSIREHHIDSTVIMFTHYPYPQYKRACMEAGADYFFHKATEFEQMLETVKRLKKMKNN
jgi:DNA-binding NarL/FixJ family response regulator